MRVAHTGLRAEVDHALELLLREQLRHAGAVGEIELHEAEPWLPLELREARLLEADVVVVVQVVEADDVVATREQPGRGVKADEAGSAGDENLHRATEPAVRPRSSANTYLMS